MRVLRSVAVLVVLALPPIACGSSDDTTDVAPIAGGSAGAKTNPDGSGGSSAIAGHGGAAIGAGAGGSGGTKSAGAAGASGGAGGSITTGGTSSGGSGGAAKGGAANTAGAPSGGSNAGGPASAGAGGETTSGGAASGGSGGGAPAAPSFPRLGGILFGNQKGDGNKGYGLDTYQAQIAKLDIAVLGFWSTWKANGQTIAQAVANIRKKSPTVLLAEYTIMTEALKAPSSDTNLDYQSPELTTQNWWAYSVKGVHTDWTDSAQYQSWDTNLTLETKPDANGDHYPQWLAKADWTHRLEGNGFDIWFCDNNFWKPANPESDPANWADYNLDGKVDDPNDPEVQTRWRKGQAAYYAQARQTAPGMELMVNTNSDLGGQVQPKNTPLPEYAHTLDGAFLEKIMGPSDSYEVKVGWATLAARYHQVFKNLIGPKRVIFGVAGLSTDYQFLRYALGTSLLDDGYFSYDSTDPGGSEYNDITWFDEFDLAGTASTKWLGAPVDDPPATAYQSGVYRRRYEHGMAIVNPKGNGPQTITIEAGYKHIAGTQDPAVNDGKGVTSVVLADRDGVILVKE